MSVDLILYIGAAICFAVATVGIGTRVNLVALGLFLWVMTNIV